LAVCSLALLAGCPEKDKKDGAAGSSSAAAAASAPASDSTSTTTSAGSNFTGDFEGVITMRTTSSHGPPQDLVIETKNEKMRFDMPMGPKGETSHAIFDPQANKVVVLMDTAKAYMDMDFGSPSAPQPNTSPDTSSVSRTGKHETIAGYDCEDWSVKDPSGKRSDVCIAQGIAFFDIGSMRPGAKTQPAWMKEFREKKYFPLRSVEVDAAGKEVSRMEVTRIEKKRLDASAFAVPPDYKKFEMPAAVPGAPGGTAPPPHPH
jgi:hypothetical protein